MQEQFPGLVPVCKGNGYGFGHERLAEEATRLGSDVLAVGTTYEAARIKDWFSGDLLVLTPYRRGEEPVPLPDRVIRSVSSVDGVYGLVGARVVIEVMSSMKRHGVSEQDLPQLHSAIENVRLEGFAIHLPLDRTDGSDAVEEVIGWMDRLRAARLPLHTMFVSHLKADELAGCSSSSRRPASAPGSAPGSGWGTTRPPSTGARSWTSHASPRGTGSATGSRRPPPTAIWWSWRAVRRTGWGLEAPKALHGVMPRAKGVARAGLATVNRNLSPFVWGGKQRWFAEPPHMQVSILFVPADAPEPKVGEELVAHLRHTTTQFDRLLDR
ncbi:alanine racemase [Streptomyces heliomycini]